MSVIAQTLEKTSVQTDIVGAIRDLKTVIQDIKQPETVEQVKPVTVDGTVPSWAKELIGRVKSLEK